MSKAIQLYGIDFAEDEVDVILIDGQPEWVVNLKGARRLADLAPDPVKGAEFRAFLDRIEAGGS